jgi:hypothetical protein
MLEVRGHWKKNERVGRKSQSLVLGFEQKIVQYWSLV